MEKFDGSPPNVATPLWGKCEDETHTPKSGNLEFFGTPKNSELDCRGQNTSHWGVIYVVTKVLKFGYPKMALMSHLNIYSPCYGQKKGWESNWQFDSWPLKVGNQPNPGVCKWIATRCWKALKESYKFSLDLMPIGGLSKKLWMPKSQESQSGQFRESTLGVLGKSAIQMQVRRSNTENTIWGKVVASLESGSWWVKWVHVARGLSQH